MVGGMCSRSGPQPAGAEVRQRQPGAEGHQLSASRRSTAHAARGRLTMRALTPLMACSLRPVGRYTLVYIRQGSSTHTAGRGAAGGAGEHGHGAA